MAVRTKPVRIFEDDHRPLQLLAHLRGVSVAELVHTLLAQHLQEQKEELATAFAATQAAFQAGDLEALTNCFAASAEARADQMMQGRPGRRAPAHA